MNPISSISTPTAADSLDRIPKKTLDQDDFLKLLVAQFTTQDPLKPEGDLSFIAQMAQFTSLEQSKAMQADIARLQTDSRFATANSLIGREVTLAQGEEAPLTGTVSGIVVADGSPHVVVDGRPYPITDVLGVAPTSAENN